MVSKNNQYWKQQQDAQRVPHYGLRKLSVGVASVLLSTTLYMGVTAHADTVTTPSEQPAVNQPTSAATDTSTGSITVESQSTADKTANVATNSAAPENDASAKPVQTVSPEQPANTDSQPTEATNVAQPVKNLNVESDNNESAAKTTGQSADSAALMTNFAVINQPTDGTHNSDTTTLNTTFKWSIHYTDEAGKKLLPDSVITHDYTRTDTGNQMGNWSYVPDSVKVTGTPNNGWHIDNPNFKFDQAAGGTTFDFATWQAAAASIDGYTPNYGSVALTDQLPKNPESLHATTTVDSGTHEFTFVYTQRPKTVTINYVNDDNETVVKTDSVSGKAATEVTITPQLPKDYMLTPNKDVPSTYTVTDADNQVVTIHVQKQFVDTSTTDPQAKQTRTITLHYVYGAGDKQGQPAFDDAVLDVYYHRTATLDRATNQTTYGDWMWDQSQGDSSTPGYHVVSGKWTSLPQTWANVAADVPSIKGYYADLGQNDPTNTNHIPSNTWVFPTYNNSLGGGISEGGKGATAYLDGYGYEVNPIHTIKYMPNKTTVTVNYVDDDNNKAVVGSQHWDGTIGQHIDLTLTPPDNYVLTPGWGNPSSYDFDGTNSSWYTVHVKHKTQDVTDQQPKDQVNKTETLTRKHLYGPGPHEGEKFGDPDIIEVPWHRTAIKDLVTGKVNFGDWHVVWDKVKQLSGATKMWGDSEHNWVNGGLIAVHSGYSYLGVGSKTERISMDGTVGSHGWYWMGEQDIENNPTIVQYYGREKVGVPVNYVDFDTNQQLTTRWLTGDNYLDGNTITLNKDDWTDWGKAVSNNYQLYAKQTLPTIYKIDTVSNDGNLTPITVYVVQPRTVQFTFADNDSTVNGQHPQVGDAVSVTGMTGSTTPVSLTVPVGYKLVEGQQLPTTYTFVKGEQNQVILLTHQHTTVQPDAPKTPSDKLPDNPSESYPSGVAKDDLNKTVTRKVTIVTPDGKQTVTNQTVTFTRNATVDEVTGNVTYGPWSENGKHEFATVNVPTVAGYTANGDVPSLTVTPDSKDTTVTISYTANKQQININYVDVNDGNKVVHTTTVNGVTDGDSVVSNELPTGYKLVDGQSVPKTIHFSADNNDDINIKVQHSVVTVTPDSPKTSSDKLPDNPDKSYPSGVSENDLNKTITRTIKVTTPDGQTKTVEQAVHLTRTADVDEVTSEVTYSNWTTGEWANYDVPMVQGYTASQNEVPTTKVTGDTKNQTVTVTYNADHQKLIVNFIDDTTGQTLKTVNKDGLTNSNSNYNTKSDIQNYVNNHYRLVSDDTNGQNLVFDNDDNKTQTYNVHLAHNTHNINDSKTITETIHYKLDNGQKAFDDHKAQLSFTRTGYNDEVTGQDHWNNWQATNGQTFNAVQSPSKKGYTPDKTSIETVNVKPGDKNIDTTVTYNANAQVAKISYIDDNTGATLKTDNANGKFNQAISFDNNVDNQIKDYEQQGYALKSNNFSNQTYQADNAKNVFEVHLIHGTKNVQRTQKITETVQYQMEDGTKAPVTNSQSTSFTQDGVQDLVTNNIDWKAIAPHQFKEVITPVMTGYTPDITSIPVITVNFGDKDISKIVTYKTNAQTAKISYIDDNTGATLKSDNTNGKFNQAISFGDVDGAIKGFEDKGYQLKSNSFKGQKYQADNNSNVFEVHLVHGTKNVQRTQKITETINYQMDDGSKAPAANTQSVDFTQDGVQDLVTNNIDWKATEPQQFKAVDMPTVNGYTPDIANVPATTVNFGDKDIHKLVTYKANAQSATINYIDDTTGKTIKTDNANGKFNQPISFDNNVDNQIKAFENQGYVLKSNSFNGQKYQADNNSNVFEVHLVHGTKNVQRTQKITETVNYQMDDGSQAPSTNTQSVNFTQNGVQDLVTNNIDWKATESQQFKAVDSLALTGYTPDIVSVPVTTVSFGDKDINKTVTYKANPQSAKITYIDDNTGKTLKMDDANGKFNQVIDFANMNSDIKDFENQGYVLKSNSFNGQKYQADNAKNTFEVHFTHGTKNVQRQDTITETVKYQYDNGTPAHENNVQTLNFTQDGVQDLVTKNIDWKPTDAQEFKQVGTPAIDGYTPDITSISATKVNFGDSDINKVVTYQANNQTANIHYVDDMTGSSIDNGTANGKFGTVIDFGNVNDKINTFKSLGYQLVSNDFSGQTYQSDNSKNVYYVHFTHGIKNIQRNKQITETIKYQYENGQQAQPDSVQTVSFNENGSQDLVTKKINWFNDVPQQFKAVSTPTITGYTADIDNIPAVVVNYDNDNINKVVTYKANSQTAKINYIDDTTGKVIKTDIANGKFNQTISFSETPTNVINDLIKRGYKLVSNSFNGQTYQNDNSKNEFTVHLAHNTKNVSKQNTVTRTINYLDNNGKAIQTPTVETVTFTQNGITDLVTGNTTWNTPSSQTFETVTSPTIKGFGKPDVEVVKSQTVNFNDQNVVVNVHYTKVTTPTNVNNNTTTPTVDHDKGKLNPTTFTTTAHQTTPQAHTANNGGQQSITPQSVNKPSEQPTVANNGTKADTLPQTGNSDDNSTAIVGLGLLSGMLGLLGLKGKKKQN